MVWDKMGGGKMLTMAYTSVFTMGVMFVIVPLLTLMVDLLQKLRGSDPRYVKMIAHNLDKFLDKFLKGEIISATTNLPVGLTALIVILFSPQKLEKCVSLHRAIICCHKNWKALEIYFSLEAISRNLMNRSTFSPKKSGWVGVSNES